MLQIGVIGLGRLWRKRYRTALRRLRDRFQVRAVCDQVHAHAEREAERLDCQAVLGPTGLLENKDIQALLLLDSQWFGLWPLEVACRFGKPVYCCGGPEEEGASAGTVRQKVRACGLPVMVEMLPTVAPAAAKLHELLHSRLGPPRLLLGEAINETGELALLDWCVRLFGQEPASARAWSAVGIAVWLLDFGAGRAAQITRRNEPGRRSRLRLRIVAENGAALVSLPDRLRWTGPDGRHSLRLRAPSLGQILLEHFHEVVAGKPIAYPTLDDAYRAAAWLRTAASGLHE